jgi:hypothetical protein
VESSRHCYALVIGLAVMSEWEVGHDEPWHACPRPPSSFYSTARRRPTTIDWLVPPIWARGKTGVGLSPVMLGTRWGQSNILLFDLNLKNINISS